MPIYIKIVTSAFLIWCILIIADTLFDFSYPIGMVIRKVIDMLYFGLLAFLITLLFIVVWIV